MAKNLSGRKLGIIHAALITTKAMQKYIDEIIPEVEVVHWVDDTIQNTNFACEPGVIPNKNYAKFVQGACHRRNTAWTDSSGVFDVQPGGGVRTAHGQDADAPNRPAMMDLAVQQGKRIGLLATVPQPYPLPSACFAWPRRRRESRSK